MRVSKEGRRVVAADELAGVGAGSGDAGADLVGKPLDGAGEGDGAFGDGVAAAGGGGNGVDRGEGGGVEDGELELGPMLLCGEIAVDGHGEVRSELGATDLEDEVGVGGRVGEMEVAPLLEGGVELVVAYVGAAGDLAVEVVVAAGVGEEDGPGGGDAGDDVGGRGLLGRWGCEALAGGDERAQREQETGGG